MGETVQHIVGTAAQIGIHGTPHGNYIEPLAFRVLR
jgi:hypothetical protein